VAKEVMAITYVNTTSHSIKKFVESPYAGKHPKPISKCTKAAAAEAAVTAAEAIAVADLEEAKRLATKFEALGCGALSMVLAQEAQPGDPLRECWLAHEGLRAPEARTDAAEAAEVAAAETAAAVEAAAAAEAADALGAQAALAPELPKSLAAARSAWPRTPRRSPGVPCLVWGPERN
jgi:hypothetical protein